MRDLASIVAVNASVTRARVAQALNDRTISRDVAAALLGELPIGESTAEKAARRARWERHKALNRRGELARSAERRGEDLNSDGGLLAVLGDDTDLLVRP